MAPLEWTADDRELMRADKVLKGVMEEQGPIDPAIDRRGSRPDPLEAVARAIVGQQLSTKAAALDLGEAARHVRRQRCPPRRHCFGRGSRRCARRGSPTRRSSTCVTWRTRVKDGRLDLDRIKDLSDEDVVAELDRGEGESVNGPRRCS